MLLYHLASWLFKIFGQRFIEFVIESSRLSNLMIGNNAADDTSLVSIRFLKIKMRLFILTNEVSSAALLPIMRFDNLELSITNSMKRWPNILKSQEAR